MSSIYGFVIKTLNSYLSGLTYLNIHFWFELVVLFLFRSSCQISWALGGPWFHCSRFEEELVRISSIRLLFTSCLTSVVLLINRRIHSPLVFHLSFFEIHTHKDTTARFCYQHGTHQHYIWSHSPHYLFILSALPF